MPKLEINAEKLKEFLTSVRGYLIAQGLFTDTQISEIFTEVHEPKWKPKEGEGYWFVSGDGRVCEIKWVSDHWDEARYKFNNVFQTKEQAEAAREAIKKVLSK